MRETRHRFSKRTAWDLEPGTFSSAVATARATGQELFDLTVSNPTRCGFDYGGTATRGLLTTAEDLQEALIYDPVPCGMRSARESIADYYASHSAIVEPDAIVLTTSTSEAYSFLFRLLCNAGDEVLVAQPSYPLLNFLAELDDVKLKSYPLFYDFGWWIDFAELEKQIGPLTRAILVVHPNNPTGHWTHQGERERLELICERHGLALIVDEVFLDYPLAAGDFDKAKSFTTQSHRALTFVLSGISKICALPQMKVGWIVTAGPEDAVREALIRLEVVADTFLSLGSLSQLALPTWLKSRRHLQEQITERTQTNVAAIRASGLEMLHVEAGWSAILKLRNLPARLTAAELPVVERLLAETGVVVHPGDFYGLADERLVVVSLLPTVDLFHSGLERLGKFLRGSGR